jgi:transketolase
MESRKLAKEIRLHVIKMANSGGSSHVGSALSIVDIISVLYNGILRFDPKNPDAKNRDRFILSKGHAGTAVYAALAAVGFFNKEKLSTHYQDGSNLSGHISHKNIPGVEISTGSLGHGLGVGVGMSLAGKMGEKQHRVFVLLSDGECDEGSNWEAILFAAHHGLDNLIAIVDYNKIQSLAPVEETLSLEPFADKWRCFGWEVEEVDGHDHGKLKRALSVFPKKMGKPTVIIAHTTKGKGVSFMENSVLWHYRCPKGTEFESAIQELEKEI